MNKSKRIRQAVKNAIAIQIKAGHTIPKNAYNDSVALMEKELKDYDINQQVGTINANMNAIKQLKGERND